MTSSWPLPSPRKDWIFLNVRCVFCVHHVEAAMLQLRDAYAEQNSGQAFHINPSLESLEGPFHSGLSFISALLCSDFPPSCCCTKVAFSSVMGSLCKIGIGALAFWIQLVIFQLFTVMEPWNQRLEVRAILRTGVSQGFISWARNRIF